MSDRTAGRPGRLADLVRAHRAAAGLTQRQFAAQAGISLGVLEDLEQGRTLCPRRAALARLADVLRLSEGELGELTRAVAGSPQPPGSRGLRVGVLGPLGIWCDDQPVEVGPLQLRAVLGLLAVHAGTVLSRAVIADALWGEAPPPSAVAMIQAHASQIRRLLATGQDPGGPSRLSWDGIGYRLSLAGIRLDAAEFGELARHARGVAAAGNVVGAGEFYERALGLWRGQPLEDIPVLCGHPALAELARQRVAVVLDYADALAGAGQWDQVSGHLEALAAQEPLDERVHARLMLALAATGRQAAALRVYTELAARLDAELGVSPGPELRAAHLQVLRQHVQPTATPALAAVVAVGGAPAGAVAAGQMVPRQLPADVPGFAGRAAELAALTQLLDQVAAIGGTVVISAIGGTAGVGKTALAVHWAQRYAGRFPDGQLFVNLRGFGPAGAAVTPEAALRQFFDGLGVAAERIPADRDAQAALYRSLLAGKRMLIVVDNAREADQVRPLIPGGPGCLVLVTSRNQLTGLAAGQGARLLPLDVLTDAEAGELLENRLGPARAGAEPAAVAELARLCARLPLALSVAAAHAAASPGLSLATLAAELRGARARLDRLGTADAATDVRAVFFWSYRQLSKRAGRLFRMLGVHPGPDISGPAAASLADLPVGKAAQALGELTGAHLIAEHVPGRYAFHDLLRAYAAEQARTIDDRASRRAALHRVLDHYLHAGLAASRLLNPYRDQITLGQSKPQACTEEITALDQAVDWYLAEWRVLLAAQALAADEGFSAHAWQLFWVVATFLQRNGYLREMLAAGQTALSAALTAGDLAGQAVVHRHMGQAHTVLGDYAEADKHLKAAVLLHRRLANEMAEARAHLDLASLCNAQDRYREALYHGGQGLRLYRELGYRPGEAIALNEVGWALALDGRYLEALDHCAQAHAMRGELREDTVGQAHSLDSLGYIHSRLGHHPEAIACYRQALELLAGTQTVTLRAEMLAHLGDAHQAAGDAGAARRTWHQALAILDGLHHPEADRIRARLG